MSPQRRSKPLDGKVKAKSLLPHGKLKLDTLAAVRSEMSRIYRLALAGTIEAELATKFTYMLREQRACIEAEVLDDVGARLAALTARAEGRRLA